VTAEHDRIAAGIEPLADRPPGWADGPWPVGDSASRRLSRQLVDERRQHAEQIEQLTAERDAACVLAADAAAAEHGRIRNLAILINATYLADLGDGISAILPFADVLGKDGE
jgi:hypothetical protein